MVLKSKYFLILTFIVIFVFIKSSFFNLRVPENLEDVSKYPNLFAELIADNWSDDDLAKLAGQNILRVLSDVEKVCFEIIFFST